MRKLGIIIVGLVLALMVSACTIAAEGGIKVPKTSVPVVVDGSLDMVSEWNGSAVVFWANPLDGTVIDTVYMLHNDTHYLFGAVLYDPDPVVDDSFELYVNWNNITYKYVLGEGSSTLELYNITDGEGALSSNGTGVMTASSPSQAWLYAEVAIPKDEWGMAPSVYVLLMHRHTFKLDVTSKYPEDANVSDPTTWLRVEFKEVLGQYKVSITFRDRDGNPIDYVADKSCAEIAFLNGTAFTTLTPVNSSIVVLLPPENYTLTFYVYAIPVFSTTLNVNENITATYTLNNLKHVVTAFGDVVGVVEVPGEIGCIHLNPEKQMGILITNSTEPVALRLYPRVSWNYTFVAVLNALNFTYNPFVRNLLAYAPSNFSGIMMIGAPEGYPIFYFSNGTVKGYVYSREMEELEAWVVNGTFKVYCNKAPFAITINGTALRRGADYTVDQFYVTTVNAGSGELRIYYRNPAKVELAVGSKVRIFIATPYTFNGKYTVEVYSEDKKVTSMTGDFRSAVPMTVIEVPLEGLEPGTYTIEVSVTDEDSKQTIGTASATYEVEKEVVGAPAVGWEYYAVMALILLVVIVALAATLRASHTIIREIRMRYVRRKTQN